MRICPKCDRKTTENYCPYDGTPTIDMGIYESPRYQDKLIGKIIAGRFKIESVIGRGGMGVVYKGVHLSLNKDVAIKVLNPETVPDYTLIKRFYQEALALSKLNHPNTIRVFDYGQGIDGNLFIVMEYLTGVPLSEVLNREGRLSVKRSLKIAIQIAKSLEEAHSKGIIHRDLKPSNIFLTEVTGESDFVKVLDFGIAKIVQQFEAASEELTKEGMIMGSPSYMSPEQAAGKPIDHRADIYSLGVILFQMLTGHVPFKGDTPLNTLMLHLHHPFPVHKLVGLPEDLQNIIIKATQKNKEHRFASIKGMRKAMEDFLALYSATEIPDETLHPDIVNIDYKETASIHKVENTNFKLYTVVVIILIVTILLLFGFIFYKLSSKKNRESSLSKSKKVVVSNKVLTPQRKQHPDFPRGNSTKQKAISVKKTADAHEKSKTDKIKKIKLKFDIKPYGTNIYINEKKIGKTPLTYEILSENKKVILKFEKKGYETLIIETVPLKDQTFTKTLKKIVLRKKFKTKRSKKPKLSPKKNKIKNKNKKSEYELF